MKTILVDNPATGEVIGEVPQLDRAEAEKQLHAARAAQPAWEALGLRERAKIVFRFAQLVADRAEDIAILATRENGKPAQEALLVEAFATVDLANYFASRVEEILAPRAVPMHMFHHRRSYVHYRPRGVVFVISPWNAPMFTPAGESIMALLAGNAVLLKPASYTPLSALEFGKLMHEAGLPEDVLQVCTTSGGVAGEMVSAGVNYVNFTGSTAVGRALSETCGKLLIPCSMELGGKAPALVLEDADVEQAANAITWGAFNNAGQVCASVERVYAHARVYDALLEALVTRTKALRVGDPTSRETDIGAITDPNAMAHYAKLVGEVRARGGRVLTGGEALQRPGRFFAPTVVADVDETFAIARDEIFGPLVPVMRVNDDEEAIRRANDSQYGLSAYVYSKHAEHARSVAERIEAGSVTINESVFVYGLPETPWSGVKQSGVGLVHSDEGLRHLCVAYHVNEDRIVRPKNNPLVWYPYSETSYNRIRDSVGLADRRFGKRMESLMDLVRSF